MTDAAVLLIYSGQCTKTGHDTINCAYELRLEISAEGPKFVGKVTSIYLKIEGHEPLPDDLAGEVDSLPGSFKSNTKRQGNILNCHP